MDSCDGNEIIQHREEAGVLYVGGCKMEDKLASKTVQFCVLIKGTW